MLSTHDQIDRLFPIGFKLRKIMVGLSSDSSQKRLAARDKAYDLDNFKSWHEARKPSWFLSKAEATAVLTAAATCDLPLPKKEKYWEDGFETVLTILWRSPYPILTELIPQAYGNMVSSGRQCALLTLLGIIGTRGAAQDFMDCIRKYGWPEDTHSRFFEELTNLLAYGQIMLPDILFLGKSSKPQISEAIIAAIGSGKLKLDTLKNGIEQLNSLTESVLKRVLSSTKKQQHKSGISWRFNGMYAYSRYEAGVLLDLAGRLKSLAVLPYLNEFSKFSDPKLVAFAIIALLRRGESVKASLIIHAAASHEARSFLFSELRELKREKLFPAKWCTWDAFAATNMVEWLIYPIELGCEPDEIKLERKVKLSDGNANVVYLWKFRSGKKAWMAGVSGPYNLKGKPAPLSSPSTFSRFEKWEKFTPEAHIERCIATFEKD